MHRLCKQFISFGFLVQLISGENCTKVCYYPENLEYGKSTRLPVEIEGGYVIGRIVERYGNMQSIFVMVLIDRKGYVYVLYMLYQDDFFSDLNNETHKL